MTKVGYLPGSDGAQDLHLDYEPQDFSPSRIQQACELSLRRLRTTYIDALLLHDPPLDIVRQPEPFEALRRLQQAGKIRWWGVSASAPAAAEAIRLWDAPVVESPFSLADDGVAQHVLPLAAERGTGVLARSPFGSGVLMLDEAGIDRLPVTDWRRRESFRNRVRQLAGLRERLHATADGRADEHLLGITAPQGARTTIRVVVHQRHLPPGFAASRRNRRAGDAGANDDQIELLCHTALPLETFAKPSFPRKETIA